MVFGNAMGVRRDFYAPFARFLAANGIHVVTFDYRADRAADLLDWVQDLDAMLLEAKAIAPELPTFLLGHSLGGQLLGLLPHNGLVSGALNVASGSGYYRLNERMRLQVRIFWFVAVPLLTPLFGHFPGKRLRMVGDLPRGVVERWRRWCLHPGYFLAEGEVARQACERVWAPIVAYSFTDDAIIAPAAVEALHGCFTGARVERRHVAPADAGVARIGHFGFFSERHRDTLWAEAVGALREMR